MNRKEELKLTIDLLRKLPHVTKLVENPIEVNTFGIGKVERKVQSFVPMDFILNKISELSIEYKILVEREIKEDKIDKNNEDEKLGDVIALKIRKLVSFNAGDQYPPIVYVGSSVVSKLYEIKLFKFTTQRNVGYGMNQMHSRWNINLTEGKSWKVGELFTLQSGYTMSSIEVYIFSDFYVDEMKMIYNGQDGLIKMVDFKKELNIKS